MEGYQLIESAAQFAGLRASEDMRDQERASREEAPLEVWVEVVERYPDLRRWVAYNKTVPAVMLERLATDADPAVRWTVAMRRSAPADVFVRLAQDEDEAVRVRVAHNKRAPLEVVRRLATDESRTVRDAARNALDIRDESWHQERG